MRSSARLAAFCTLGCLTTFGGGCATPLVRDPLTRSLSGNAPEVQGEFWYQLAGRPIASNDETFHALLLYLDGRDTAGTFADRVRALAARQLLPGGFAGSADEAVDRGTLAVALTGMLQIRGGATMRLFGPSPRYALRAAVDAGLFPPSSPNQTMSGGQLVGVMQRAEEYERGNPADGPAHLLPAQVHSLPAGTGGATTRPTLAGTAVLPGPLSPACTTLPVYLDDLLGTPPTTGPAAGPVHLKAIVLVTQGDLVEIRDGSTAAWRQARPGMVMREGAEIRTGPKSAIRFVIPADEAFCLDSDGAVTLERSVIDHAKAQTRLALAHGRLREDLSHHGPAGQTEAAVPIEEGGVEHDTVIQSPDSALALRGTKVSLFYQPSFAPVAVSLTGRAVFTNTAGMQVAFGAANRRHVVIVGDQTSAAQQSAARQASLTTGDTPRLEFETRELAIVSQRGGFARGDVIVGDLHLSDFGTTAAGAPALPGGLDFVLQWTGGPQQKLNDLNLAVFSPLNTAASPDFVANPPFTVSLTPNSPTSVALRDGQYPRSSRSGGQISANSVGPDGLELAFWPKAHPTGNYDVRVYDLADAVQPPATTVDPVAYTVSVYRTGSLVGTYNGTIGLFQTSPTIVVPVPAAAGAAAVQARVKSTGARRRSGWIGSRLPRLAAAR